MALIRVSQWMRRPAVTVTPQTSLSQAMQLMQQDGFAHLPVVQQERLVGLVSLAAIQAVYPSPATTLSVQEIHGAMQQLRVHTVMSTVLVTVTPRLPLLTALGVMQDHDLYTVPVVCLGEVLGLLHLRDLFPLLHTLSRSSRVQHSSAVS